MIIAFDKLYALKNVGKYVGFCSGSFDLPHLGHMRFIEKCKKLCSFLVVGVGSDEATTRYKKMPILNERIRLATIDRIQGVDVSFLIPNIPADDLSMNGVKEALEKIRPDFWFVNIDAPNIPLRAKIADGLGIRLVVMDRDAPEVFPNVSTGKIIKMIGDKIKQHEGVIP